VFPGIYGFAWDTGHIVFLGIFYGVVTVILCTLAVAAGRAIRDFRLRRAEQIRWRADFHDLPAASRRCRHELCGDVASRTCDNAFDCRSCAVHAQLIARNDGSADGGTVPGSVGGFELPSDRWYHRGHTWVRPADDGVVDVGLDDLARRLLGVPDAVELPAEGCRLRVGGPAWRMFKRGVTARVLSPVDGTVVGQGGADSGFYLKVRLDGAAPDTRHLLRGAEAGAWLLREAERLQLALVPEGIGAALADGGAPVADLSAVVTPEQLDTLCGDTFLEP
jgi:Glycine cleavage H-protein